MTLIFWYLVLTALLSYINVWAYKTRGRDITLGFIIGTTILIAAFLPISAAFILGNLVHVLVSSKYKTFFGNVVVKGEHVQGH